MTARVAVKPEILRWAVNRAKKNEEAVVSKFPRFPRWLDGTERPTIHQLEDFANFTKVPLGTLFLEHPPEETLPVPFYRTIDNRTPESPSAELLDTIRKMTFRQEWMREYLERIDAAPLEFVNARSAHDPVEAIVKDMRDVLQVKEGWTCAFRSANEALRDFCQRVEEAGVLVVLNSVVGNNTHRGLDPREFRGFVLIDDLAPLVFVNAADSKSAQMFTLAHELAHVFIGQSGIFELANLEPSNNEVELKCNAVAAEFLVRRYAVAV